MPDYTVTVKKTQVVTQDVTVTAADETAARAKAITEARTGVLNKGIASFTYEVDEIEEA